MDDNYICNWWVTYPEQGYSRLTSQAYLPSVALARWPGRCWPNLWTRTRCGSTAANIVAAGGAAPGPRMFSRS